MLLLVTIMDKTNNRSVNPLGSMLVAPGKSSRLRELRDKAQAAKAPEPVPSQFKPAECEPDMSPELVLVRQLIDKRLTEILSLLPAGRQRRLFRIRYGVELDEIKNLPIKRVIAMLKVSDPQLDNLRGRMKQIVELTYNGRQTL